MQIHLGGRSRISEGMEEPAGRGPSDEVTLANCKVTGCVCANSEQHQLALRAACLALSEIDRELYAQDLSFVVSFSWLPQPPAVAASIAIVYGSAETGPVCSDCDKRQINEPEQETEAQNTQNSLSNQKSQGAETYIDKVRIPFGQLLT
uniref:HDC16113 n=1 Tax=Drosophila melanogaster TaxID=7227 RepID=Q6IJ26_DROME|nr:TPA_inf: HDC16113 [Drosophila melanogaster]